VNETIHLAEQHILFFESHLKHIDEMMVKASTSNLSTAPELAPELDRIRQDRDKLALTINDYKDRVSHDPLKVTQEAEGTKGILQTVGSQLEKILASVFNSERTLN
jgi:hypothetical protein